jgi:putative flippase GtrA
MPALELQTPAPLPDDTITTNEHHVPKRTMRNSTIWQLVRFGLVGCLNTAIDLLVLNCLLWFWPGQGAIRLLLFNTLAYACGALNSFFFNKYWTFRLTGRPKLSEAVRFILITLAAISCNDLILWFMSKIEHPAYLSPTLWTNIAKVIAIGGTILASYLGMHLWVFVQRSRKKREKGVEHATISQS